MTVSVRLSSDDVKLTSGQLLKNDRLEHVTELKELVKTKEMIPHLLLLLLFDGGSTTNCNQRVSSRFQQHIRH